MSSIPIKYLKQIKTMSALNVLISFLERADQEHTHIIEYSVSEIADNTKFSKNTVSKALQELFDLKLVESIQVRGRITKYKIIFLVPTEEPQLDGWQKAVGARKKTEQTETIQNNIKELDFSKINLLDEDINSLSVVNPNIYMTNEELGKLANRIVKEIFLPLSSGNKPNYWFAQQMKLMKDLLVQYRTEQVIAGIYYWTTINPPPNGITSLRFLQFENKKGTKLMVALDYYKQEYLKNLHELEKVKLEARQLERVRKEKEEEERKAKEKEEVESMSDDDFVKNLLGGFGTIKVGEK